MSGERDIVDELQFRVTVTRMGGQHTVREVMSDIMAMENARTEIKRLRALVDSVLACDGSANGAYVTVLVPFDLYDALEEARRGCE